MRSLGDTGESGPGESRALALGDSASDVGKGGGACVGKIDLCFTEGEPPSLEYVAAITSDFERCRDISFVVGMIKGELPGNVFCAAQQLEKKKAKGYSVLKSLKHLRCSTNVNAWKMLENV